MMSQGEIKAECLNFGDSSLAFTKILVSIKCDYSYIHKALRSEDYRKLGGVVDGMKPVRDSR